MRAGWLLVLLAGCGRVGLDIELELDPRIEAEVERVELRILRPSSALPFDCDAIAYGLVDAATLRLGQDRALQVGRGETLPLTEVERLGRKVVVADAYRAGGERVGAGCLDVGAIEDADPRRLPIFPLAFVLPEPVSGLQRELGDPTPIRLRFRVTDAGGQPLEAPIRLLRSYGESRMMRPETPIELDAPERPGPYELVPMVRWAGGAPPRQSGFVLPSPERIGIEGEALHFSDGRGLLALVERDGLWVLELERAADGELSLHRSGPVEGADGRVLRGADARLRVLSDEGWFELGPDGEVTRSALYTPRAGAPRGVFDLSGCAGGGLLVNHADGFTAFHDPEGGTTSGFRDPLSVVSAGCVANALGSDIRALVIDIEGVGLRLVAELAPTQFVLRDWIAIDFGLRFTAPFGEQPRSLVATQLELNDFVVSRAVLRVSAERFELDTLATDRPPGVPLETAVGDIDGDGALDLLSLLQPEKPGGPHRLWVVRGASLAGERISGTAELAAMAPTRLRLADLDGDGTDDIILAREGAGGALTVYAMGLFSPGP